MTNTGKLGITKLLGLHYYVRDLARSRRFYVDCMAFDEVGVSSEELNQKGQQRSLAFRAGEVVVVCSAPSGEASRAARYLSRHPDGIGTIVFEVADIEHTFAELERDGGTPISDIVEAHDEGGRLRTFSITTPFGDTTFRFIQNEGYAGLFPGIDMHREVVGGGNQFGFTCIDHVTSNFQTMKPALLWLEHVLGFQPLWEVEFHTQNQAKKETSGSGLRSKVMWDPLTGIKFANNEPYRPFFKQSQINLFHAEHRGDGVQHVALGTRDIIAAVRGLAERGAQFMPTPRAYYDLLPERLRQLGIGALEEDLRTLADLSILVDGHEKQSYLLQIFLRDAAGLYGSAEAGPFFYELIQRKGDQGFGAGNFRALFESIEHEQAGTGGH